MHSFEPNVQLKLPEAGGPESDQVGRLTVRGVLSVKRTESYDLTLWRKLKLDPETLGLTRFQHSTHLCKHGETSRPCSLQDGEVKEVFNERDVREEPPLGSTCAVLFLLTLMPDAL